MVLTICPFSVGAFSVGASKTSIYYLVRSDSELNYCFGLSSQIFIAYPSGRVIERECDGHEKVLVSNLGLKNYKAAAVGVTKFEPLRSKVVVEVGKQVKREIAKYSKDPSNLFKYRGDLEQLAKSHNDSFIGEVEEKMPVLHTLIETSFRSSKKVKHPSNKQALIFSSILNPWIPISNFRYRINTILVLGGCKKEEVDCLNKLGLSSHPNTLRNMQKKAAQSFDKVVVEWKDDTVSRNSKINLFEEVLKQQHESTVNEDNAMEICTVDFSTEAVSNCSHYSEAVHRSCKQMLQQNEDTDLFEDTDILSALAVLKEEDTQKFRYIIKVTTRDIHC